jgi:hypothetical protein
MKQSHLERLAQGLPADMQASFLEATKGYSSDGNDPIEAFFSALSEARRRDAETILEKFAADDAWKSQLREQLAKDRAESAKNLKQEIGALTGDGPWRRGIVKSIVNGIVWGISVVASTVVISLILLNTKLFPLEEVIGKFQKIAQALSDDPASLAEFAKYSKEANSEALSTAKLLHAMSKLMAIPKMQITRGDDGFLIFYAPESFMPVGTTSNGLNWFKLGDIQAIMRADTTLSIDKATEAKKKLEKK